MRYTIFMTVCRHTNNYTLDPWSVSISCLEMDVRQQLEGANASWKKITWCTRLHQRVVFPQSCRRLALIARWSCPCPRLSTRRWTPAPLGKIESVFNEFWPATQWPRCMKVSLTFRHRWLAKTHWRHFLSCHFLSCKLCISLFLNIYRYIDIS